MGTIVTHKKGVPWYVAPRPWCWHSCAPWTVQTWIGSGSARVEHCRCGGERCVRSDGTVQYGWVLRNSRRNPKPYVPAIPAPYRHRRGLQ